MLEAPRDGVDLGLRLLERRAAFQPREHVEIPIPSTLRIVRRDQGPKEIRVVSQHVRRQHADDGERIAVDGQRLADDVRVGPEAALPEGVREDDNAPVALPLLVLEKPAAEHRVNPQRRQPSDGDERAPDSPLAGSVGIRDGDARAVVGGHLLEDVVLISDVKKIW